MEGFPDTKHMVKTIHKKEYPAISPLNPANTAANKTVFITGGGTGIGYAIARGFALAGASTIIITGRRANVLEASAKRLSEEIPSAQVLGYPLDISDSEAVDGTFAEVTKNLEPGKKIDILVLCAAQGLPAGKALSFSTSQIRAFTDTNILGNINIVRAFLNTTDTSDAVILEVASNAAHMVYPGMALYSITKGAFTSFLRHIVAEYHGTGLRVHSFNPGSVLTDPAKEAGMDENSLPWDDASLPAGFGVWLASPQAAFLHGRFVMSAWDVDELSKMKKQYLDDEDLGKIVLKIKPDLVFG
ncbi:hypothetical protein C7974DRAFT_360088 [Boeremia exigua]|uniref:uncharacterized protein n=1 Tax=Boeremia exigua TaxID=749465 RepID=UPI001E8CD86A|nr:uncharacterized protein C7974DRAFT_360088 [Boeremia exigua]KAH6625172.1 hypothetical protein C7974DRAFT_360088 [Boeremia exigua]